MKTVFTVLALLCVTTAAHAALPVDTACNEAALQVANTVFGPLDTSRIAVKAVSEKWVNGGGHGEHSEIKIALRGTVNGYVVMKAFPNDSDSCNLTEVRLSDK